MEKVYTKNAPDAFGPYSQAVKVNGLFLHRVRLQLTMQQAMLRLQQLRLRQGHPLEAVLLQHSFLPALM